MLLADGELLEPTTSKLSAMTSLRMIVTLPAESGEVVTAPSAVGYADLLSGGSDEPIAFAVADKDSAITLNYTFLVTTALEGRPVWFGVVGGLALMVRPDLIIFVVCVALGSALIRRQLGRAAFTTVAVGAPWFLFVCLFFVSAIADTLVVKMVERSFLGYAAGSGVVNWTYFEGPQFYLRSLDVHYSVFRGAVVSFVPAAAGLLALLVWSGLRLGRRVGVERLDPVASAAVGGLVYYGAYSLLGVPPYQWYYVAPILALSTFLLVTLGALVGALGRRWWVEVPVLTMVAGTLLAAVLVDARQGLPWQMPVIFGNWATCADYARAGTAVGARVGDAGVIAPQEIGTLAYYCDCELLDKFSDRGRVIPLIDARIQQSAPFARALLKLNYLWLDRTQEPRPAEYELRWVLGPSIGPDDWQTWSPVTGINHLTLLPAE